MEVVDDVDVLKLVLESTVVVEEVISIEVEDLEVDEDVSVEEILVLVDLGRTVVVILGGSPEHNAIEFSFCLTWNW